MDTTGRVDKSKVTYDLSLATISYVAAPRSPEFLVSSGHLGVGTGATFDLEKSIQANGFKYDPDFERYMRDW
jgi:hypothetical protein